MCYVNLLYFKCLALIIRHFAFIFTYFKSKFVCNFIKHLLNIFLGMANPFGLTSQSSFQTQSSAQSTFSGPTTSSLPPPLVPSPNPFLS